MVEDYWADDNDLVGAAVIRTADGILHRDTQVVPNGRSRRVPWILRQKVCRHTSVSLVKSGVSGAYLKGEPEPTGILGQLPHGNLAAGTTSRFVNSPFPFFRSFLSRYQTTFLQPARNYNGFDRWLFSDRCTYPYLLRFCSLVEVTLRTFGATKGLSIWEGLLLKSPPCFYRSPADVLLVYIGLWISRSDNHLLDLIKRVEYFVFAFIE